MNRVGKGLFLVLVSLAIFSGNIYGATTPYLEADLMIIEEETEIVTCEGNVYYHEEDLKIRGDFGTFYLNDLSFFFTGRVTMNYLDILLKSKELEGNIETEDLLARGEVEIEYPEYFMKGDFFQLINVENRAFLEGNSYLDGEIGKVFGDRMDWDLDFSYLEVTGSARWDGSEGKGSAFRIIFNEEEGIITFSKEAFVELSNQSFYGEEIIYYMDERRMRIIKGGILLPSTERD